MSRIYSAVFGAVVSVLAISSAPSPLGAQQSLLGLDEFRLGGAAVTDGQSINGSVEIEGLFAPLHFETPYDPKLSWLFSPRPLVGANISLQGKTSEVFAGLAWNVPIWGPFFAEMSFGGLVHDQKLNQDYSNRAELTTRFLFREAIAIGYEIDASWRVVAFADHGSNGNLGYRNYSLNHFGVMVGKKLGDPAKKVSGPPAGSISDFSWAGLYVGVSGGGAHSKSDGAIHMAGVPDNLADSSNPKGSLIVGGYAGYNWVIGKFVTGIEGDISAQKLTYSMTRNIPVHEEFSASSLMFATARARIGMEIDRIWSVQRPMLYATGGAAFTRIGKSYCNPTTCYVGGDVAGGWFTEGEKRVGWTAGGGIEIPLASHTSARFEYLYADFGNFSVSNGSIRNDFNFSEQILRAGMSMGFRAF